MGKYTDKARQMRPYIEKAVQSLPDEEALEVKTLYSSYGTLVNERATVNKDFRFAFGEDLWKTEQPSYTFDGQYAPGDPGTESLFSKVAKPGEGTHDNPIVYNNNMALEKDLYYTQFNVLYICTRDTGVPVFNNLADLVGLYVEVTE